MPRAYLSLLKTHLEAFQHHLLRDATQMFQMIREKEEVPLSYRRRLECAYHYYARLNDLILSTIRWRL